MMVITNIEHDHPDMYPDIDSVRKVFQAFLLALPVEGTAIVCGDDHEIQKILLNFTGKKITYGFNPNNDVILERVSMSVDKTFFHARAFGSDLGEFMLNIPGEHNCLNALAATITCLEAGLSLQAIKAALIKFTGTKRRLEYKGKLRSGALLYDDYGHHPTEIKKTLATLRAMYPKKRIISVFQPHTYSRTKALFNDFVRSFAEADTVVLLNIFASAREKPDLTISSRMLAEGTKKVHKDVQFLPELDDVVKYLDKVNPNEDTVIITIGAGDVYKIGDRLQVISPKL
jgi:UDP-N-acetylmuramate--alanine ligase